MKTYDSISRLDETFTFFEMKEVELATYTLSEASSWIDWWLYAVWSISRIDSSVHLGYHEIIPIHCFSSQQNKSAYSLSPVL